MQKHWLIRSGNENLIVFALGWGSDYHAVEHIRPDGYDILCTYDYRSIEPLTEKELGGYEKIWLFAWSFGVWAAERIFYGTKSKTHIAKAVAFCGTPRPAHNEYGIPLKPLAVTLRGILQAGTDEFNRRAYGESYEILKPYLSNRTTEEKYEELKFLTEEAQKEYTPSIEWNKVVIGLRDTIFPPENVKRYWGDKAEVLDTPHYPFADPGIVTKFL